jgi:hypothetical protein
LAAKDVIIDAKDVIIDAKDVVIDSWHPSWPSGSEVTKKSQRRLSQTSTQHGSQKRERSQKAVDVWTWAGAWTEFSVRSLVIWKKYEKSITYRHCIAHVCPFLICVQDDGREIVTNIMMIASKIRPDMDEYDLIRIIRSKWPSVNVSITNDSTDEEFVYCFRRSASAIFVSQIRLRNNENCFVS